MTNDKDSAMPNMKIQSPETYKELFRINADGTVTGGIQNASEAAKVFFESFRDLIQRNIRQPAQSYALREALERIEAATRNEVRAGDKGYVSRYGINGIARAALEQSK